MSINFCERTGCSNPTNLKLGSGRFCSRSCANARIRSESTKKKISDGVKRSGKIRPPLSEESLERWRVANKLAWKQKYQNTSFDELSRDKKRLRVIEEQNYTCADCKLIEWKGKPITLELDHKDGNSENDQRDNLWAICPNCHSYTETWRGKNKPHFNGKIKVSDEILLAALRRETSIRKALLSVGLAGKGGNYARAKQLIDNN